MLLYIVNFVTKIWIKSALTRFFIITNGNALWYEKLNQIQVYFLASDKGGKREDYRFETIGEDSQNPFDDLQYVGRLI